jgi:hypothetical protein
MSNPKHDHSLSKHRDIVETHKELLDLLKWDEKHTPQLELVQDFGCEIKQGIKYELEEIKPLTANI